MLFRSSFKVQSTGEERSKSSLQFDKQSIQDKLRSRAKEIIDDNERMLSSRNASSKVQGNRVICNSVLAMRVDRKLPVLEK